MIKLSLNIRRILAYVFDTLALSILAGFLAMTPLNPNYKAVESLQDEYAELMDSYTEKLESYKDDEESYDKTLQEFQGIAKEYSIKITKKSIYSRIISLVLVIGYFVIFAYFFNGQTIGKKLMKIRITDKDGQRVSLIQLAIRTIILYEIPFDLLSTILAFTCSIDTFYKTYSVIYYLNIAVNIGILITMLTRLDKRGLHDLIAHTKVAIEGEENLLIEKGGTI